MNTDISNLEPGTFGVSHGSGMAGELIRHATGSWAGHAFIYVGGGMIVQGQPPAAELSPAASHDDAIWAWRMWDQLKEVNGWADQAVAAAQEKVTGRAHALVGDSYDFPAYIGFALEVLKLRDEKQMEDWFRHDTWRVCSALVADALDFGGVPLDFTSEDGPGLDGRAGQVPPPVMVNLVAPGMLLGLAQRKEWT